MRLLDHLVDWWMAGCKHEPHHVLEDLLEGSGNGVEVKYCRRCGAVRTNYESEFRRPRPLWHV